jgi:hypothetical protein
MWCNEPEATWNIWPALMVKEANFEWESMMLTNAEPERQYVSSLALACQCGSRMPFACSVKRLRDIPFRIGSSLLVHFRIVPTEDEKYGFEDSRWKTCLESEAIAAEILVVIGNVRSFRIVGVSTLSARYDDCLMMNTFTTPATDAFKYGIVECIVVIAIGLVAVSFLDIHHRTAGVVLSTRSATSGMSLFDESPTTD